DRAVEVFNMRQGDQETARPPNGRILFKEISPGLLVSCLYSFALRDAERLPVRAREMFRQQHNLTDVRRVMRQLTVDRLDHGVRLAADRDGSAEIVRLERRQRAEEKLPARFPPGEDVLARVGGLAFELA